SQLLHNGCVHSMLLLAQLQQLRDQSSSLMLVSLLTTVIFPLPSDLGLEGKRTQSFTYYAGSD
ncbi:MAG: hypothetical protein WBV90_05775, partial [Terrimicrobiaceae bacterium]